jgi:hypothetical protein
MNIPDEQSAPYGRKVAAGAQKKTKRALNRRHQDRGSSDDADPVLPVFIRFTDLVDAGIVTSWMQLSRLIDTQGFPTGVLLSTNTRAWRRDEIDLWLASRPTARKAVCLAGGRRIPNPKLLEKEIPGEEATARGYNRTRGYGRA